MKEKLWAWDTLAISAWSQWLRQLPEVVSGRYQENCRVTQQLLRRQDTANDPRRRWSEIETKSMTAFSCLNGFATFCIKKISRIKAAISSRLGNTFEDPLQSDVRHATSMLTDITPPSTDEIYKLICSIPVKSSFLDKIPCQSTRRAPMCLLH